jgi:hypothetical protein
LVYTQFIVCLVLSNSTAHPCGRAANFDTFFDKRELAENTLRKAKSVKTALSNTRFVYVTKSNQGRV